MIITVMITDAKSAGRRGQARMWKRVCKHPNFPKWKWIDEGEGKWSH